MKKLLALIMALMMMFSLAACNQTPSSDDKDDSDEKKYEEVSLDKADDEDEEEEDEKKSSKKEDLEDIIDGKWVAELNFAELFNMGMASETGDDEELAEALALDEFPIAIILEIDGDEATMSMEAVDIDDVKDELADKISDLDLEVSDDELDKIIDEMVDSIESESETCEFELDGDILVFDGEEFGTATVKNEDKIVVELADESAEAFESLGIDSKLTFERD